MTGAPRAPLMMGPSGGEPLSPAPTAGASEERIMTIYDRDVKALCRVVPSDQVTPCSNVLPGLAMHDSPHCLVTDTELPRQSADISIPPVGGSCANFYHHRVVKLRKNSSWN